MYEKKVESLTREESDHLDKQRTWVREHWVPERQHLYDTLDGKLLVLQRILDEKWVGTTETWKLQSMGVTFGDALAQKLGLRWIAVEDKFGRDPALEFPGVDFQSFPVKMISKQVERGEEINVRELFDVLCNEFSNVIVGARKVN